MAQDSTVDTSWRVEADAGRQGSAAKPQSEEDFSLYLPFYEPVMLDQDARWVDFNGPEGGQNESVSTSGAPVDLGPITAPGAPEPGAE